MVTQGAAAAGNRRSAARLAAVQALYQVEMSGQAAAAVVDEFRTHRLGQEYEGLSFAEADMTLFTDVVSGYHARAADIDRMIGACLDKDRMLERLEAILRAVLRAAGYELLARAEVPARVVISEYLNVTHAFFSGNEPGFANGVLDRLAHALRPNEFEGAGGGRSGRAR
jgi:N utilization substance protein B